MKKVKSTVILKRTDKSLPKEDLVAWSLVLESRLRVIEEIIQNFAKEDTEEIILDIVMHSPFQSKTTSQLGYIHVAIKPQFISWCREQGNDESEEELWDNLKAELGFTIIRESKVDKNTYLDIMSFAEASKEQTSDFIEQSILFMAENKVHIESPDEYRKRKGIKEWS